MGTTTASVEPYRRTVLMLTLFVVLLVVGRWTRLSDSHVALLWPAAGMGVWWFLGRRSPVRRTVEAALLVSAAGAVYLLSGAPLAVAGALSVVNLAHAGVGAWVVHRSGVDRWGLRGPSGPVHLLIASLTAGLVAGLLAAVVAATLLDDSVLSTFVLVWVRNTTGTFLVLILVFGVTRPHRVRELVSGPRLGEWCAALLLGVLLYGVVFGVLPGLPLTFVVLPLWVWAGVRLGLARTSVLSVVTGVVAVVLTLQGYGVASTIALPPARAAAIQAFLLVTVLTSTMLACLQEDRERIDAALTAARVTLSESIDAALIGSSLMVAQGERVGQMLRSNPALRRLLRTETARRTGDGVPQRPVQTGWLGYLRPADRTAVQEVLAHMGAGVRQDWTGELMHQLADGSVVWAEVHLSVLPMQVTDGDSVLPVHVTDDGPARGAGDGPTARSSIDVTDHPRVVVAQFLDITARKDAEAQLVHLALHDELTGLANRVLLRDRVELALGAARRSRSQVALIFFDLDHFKHINDSLGHGVGDCVLTVVAQRMRATLRPADTVARVGGDEFVVCCPDITNRGEAEDLAQRLVLAVSEPVWVQDRFVPVGVSAGLTLSRFGDDAVTLLKQGDAAMYAAKRSGRGRVSSFSQALEAQASRHLTLSGELRDALALEQFVVHYQPIVDITTGTVTACEALVRWQHPTRGMLAPGEWLDVAEASDLIITLGEWVLRRSCRDMSTLAEQVGPLKVHINVSGRQLVRAGLVEQVVAALHDTGLPAHLVVLELTETHLFEVDNSLLADFSRLHHLGVEIAVDDFGTGFSSLTQLIRLPVDEVKIDRSFVSAASDDKRAGAVIQGVLGMARALGLHVVAEGVETPAQAAMLLEMGCITGQGYLWSPPLELSRFRSLIL